VEPVEMQKPRSENQELPRANRGWDDRRPPIVIPHPKNRAAIASKLHAR
jgi:hypothetical protein